MIRVLWLLSTNLGPSLGRGTDIRNYAQSIIFRSSFEFDNRKKEAVDAQAHAVILLRIFFAMLNNWYWCQAVQNFAIVNSLPQ